MLLSELQSNSPTPGQPLSSLGNLIERYRTLSQRHRSVHRLKLAQQVAHFLLNAPLQETLIDQFLYQCTLEQLQCNVVHRLTWLNAISVQIVPSMPEERFPSTQDTVHKKLDRIHQALPFFLEWNTVSAIGSFKHDTASESKPNKGRASLDKNGLKSPPMNSIYGRTYTQLEQIGSISLREKYNLTGKNVTVLVLDSGFDWRRHNALAHVNILGTWDFVKNDSNVWQEDPDHPDQYIHGTKVLGIMASKVDYEYYGNAYDAQYLLAKTENIPDETLVEEDHFVAALIWGQERGAQVMSASLGYSFPNIRLNGLDSVATKGINAATALGVVCVVSAGNQGLKGETSLTVPADAFLVISVGAIDSSRNLASFSSLGPSVDLRTKPELVALGVSNPLLDPTDNSGNAYNSGSGTSFSAPLVAGLVAQLVEGLRGRKGQSQLNVAYIRALLLSTASQVSSDKVDNVFGWGIPNGEKAFEEGCTSDECVQEFCDGGRCVCFEDHVGDFCGHSPANSIVFGEGQLWMAFMVCVCFLMVSCQWDDE